MSARLFIAALCCCGCVAPPELELEIRLPDDRKLLAAVTQANLSAARDGVLLSQQSFPAMANRVSLANVSHGPDTVITLDGVDAAGHVIARGRTCAIDFQGSGATAPLYFAPTNFFAPTAATPLTTRLLPVALALDAGSVLLIGGASDTGTVYDSTELFVPGAATFAESAAVLHHARWRAQAATLPLVGLLIVGGVGADGSVLADAELYDEALEQFLPVSDTRLDARVGHRVVALPDGRAFVSGGSNTNDGTPLATTLFVYVSSDGTYQVSQGAPLAEMRREHAATVAIGVPMVFGGYGSDGAPLDSIEAIDPASSLAAAAPVIAHLTNARAEATATLLANGSILLVGGIGADRMPLANAELFNPITRTTTVYPMAASRYRHSATLLADGRVLVAGGLDAQNNAISSVELFAADVGFLTERSLSNPRANHLAVPLCDGTVLVVGGATGAELYTEPVN